MTPPKQQHPCPFCWGKGECEWRVYDRASKQFLRSELRMCVCLTESAAPQPRPLGSHEPGPRGIHTTRT